MTGSGTLRDLLARAAALTRDGRRAVLGITGPPGAGKSTLAEQVVAGVAGAAYLPMDGYHLADVQLDRLGLRDCKGAPETFDAAGYVATLRRVVADDGVPVYAPGFERDLEQPIAAALVVPATARLVVTEGNYLLLPQPEWTPVRELLTEVWYVDLAAVERRRRLVARHVGSGKDESSARAWVDRVDEPNARLVEATRDRAELVVDLDQVVG